MASSKRLFNNTLRFEQITCQRGSRLLFQNFSAALGSGGVLRLAGANGAGKTSLLRIAAGALPCAGGRMLWDDADILENGSAVHNSRFAFLPADDRDLKLLETARENLGFWARLWGLADQKTVVAAALTALGLSTLANAPVRILSAGQKRRLSLARMVMKPSPLWLMDEPFNALDDAGITLLMQALQTQRAAGGMAILATHHHPDIAGMETAVLMPQAGVL